MNGARRALPVSGLCTAPGDILWSCKSGRIHLAYFSIVGGTPKITDTIYISVCSMNNVNPGLINPKRLFNWEGTIEVSDNDCWRSTPLINKPWFMNPGLPLLPSYRSIKHQAEIPRHASACHGSANLLVAFRHPAGNPATRLRLEVKIWKPWVFHMKYPLVMIKIAIEHGHL